MEKTSVRHPAFRGKIGVGRRDITPPLGIYARMWGSAQNDVALGIHRPLTATTLVIVPVAAPPMFLASLDLGWWRSAEDEWFLREPILREFGLDESQLLIHLSHTHAGPSISLQAHEKPGGDKIRPYLIEVREKLIETMREAQRNAVPATLAWHQGRCQLACNRNQSAGDETIVGYSPQSRADDAVLVGRVTTDAGAPLATIVNYACHPTTLGGANSLISPDYVGAAREVAEQGSNGAPCLFLLGAAGDLAPRRQYLADVEAADRNGRQLGYAVLATLADMLPHLKRLEFDRVEESTTRLGRWSLFDDAPSEYAALKCLSIELPLKSSRLSTSNGDEASASDRASLERMERMIHMWCGLEDAEKAAIKAWLWQLGDALLIGAPGELHSPFQLELRRHFSEYAVAVVNLSNGYYGYFPPLGDFQERTYPCETCLFQPGVHETILETSITEIEAFLATAKRSRCGAKRSDVANQAVPRPMLDAYEEKPARRPT